MTYEWADDDGTPAAAGGVNANGGNQANVADDGLQANTGTPALMDGPPTRRRKGKSPMMTQLGCQRAETHPPPRQLQWQ